MRLRNLFMILLLCMTVGLFAVSCSDGKDGAPGAKGEQGEPGPPGTPAPTPEPEEEDEDMSMDADCTHTFGSRDRQFDGGDADEVICGNDRRNIINGMKGDDVIRGAGGNDTLEGNDGDDELYGGAGDDMLHGNDDDDMLFGGAGDDTLTGGPGQDEVDGGPGDDTIIDSDDDFDVIEGGPDTDTLSYSMILDDNGTEDATDGRELLEAGQYLHVSLTDGESAIGTLPATGFEEVTLLDDISGIENVVGAAGSNHLVGDEKNNELTGGDANDDKIKGMGGNDILGVFDVDDPGTELYDGGAGNDTLIVTGSTFVFGTTAPVNAAGTQGITNIENVMAEDVNLTVTAQANTFTGDGKANRLYGGQEADVLNGMGGDDTIDGGPGVDAELRGGTGADTFIIVKGEHGDTILDYSGKGRAADGDKIVLKGFTSDDKKNISVNDDSGLGQTQIQLRNGATPIVVANIADLGGSNFPRADVIYEFMD